ncbi:inhibin alpha chain [Hyperolius riggenbachi]|uniref:inhibin alpha chain n=1 Tax=Hyperolius riggenbachi TaxID=752182 RepID=UPI0035A30964
MSSSWVFLLILVFFYRRMGESCEIPEDDRQVLLDRVKAQITEALGPPPDGELSSNSTVTPKIPSNIEHRILRKRHSQKTSSGTGDSSQVILFPSSDVLCETQNLDGPKNESGNSYTYVFRPSTHILSRRISSVEFWFFTGKSVIANLDFLANEELHTASPGQSLLHKVQLPPSISPVRRLSEEQLPHNRSPVHFLSEEQVTPSLSPVQPLSEEQVPPNRSPVWPLSEEQLPPNRSPVWPLSEEQLPPNRSPVQPLSEEQVPPNRSPVQSSLHEEQLSPNRSPIQSSLHEEQPPHNLSPLGEESEFNELADTGDSKEETLQNLVDIEVLSDEEPITVATTKIRKMDDWTVFSLAPAFFSYLTKSLFVLLVHCPNCPCSNEPENTPFLLFNTQPVQRGRRSGVPWSPSALELLQRPPQLGDSAQCHRGSINITFEELGWNQWIVHPGSFQFHYCHGTCTPNHGLTAALHWGHCCAALPSTMKPLRVTTTTDGGFSFRYETVPNLLTQDCACS